MMIALDTHNYDMAKEPLTHVAINNLFARSVVEKRMPGSVFVENVQNPKTFYVVHPYGMSLLFGECTNEKFNLSFREHALNIRQVRNTNIWMQAFPKAWDPVLNELFKDCIVESADKPGDDQKNIIDLNTRINFKFNANKYLSFRKNKLNEGIEIVRTDKKTFKDMKGSVIPLHFWQSADDFDANGVGFSLFHHKELASTVYSAFIHDNKLELGIETIEQFRGKGYAKLACSALIDYCLEHNFEPIWACRLENVGSYKLAQKLGFEPTERIPYYRLSD